MPIIATLSFIAAAAMARRIPLSSGFLSKEMMLEEASHTAYLGLGWLFPVLATAAALLSASYSIRFAIRTFLGPARHDYPRPPHDPPVGLWLPVAVLVLPILAIGVAPETIVAPIVEPTARAVVGGALPPFEPALWHGFTAAAVMSAIALVGGALLFAAYGPTNALRVGRAQAGSKRYLHAVTGSAVAAARQLIDCVHDGSLARYVGVMLVAIIAVGAAGFAGDTYEAGTRATLSPGLPGVIAWITLVAASGAVAVRHRDRLLSLVLTSIVGLIVSLAFIQLSAPDLALTQITVDVVTTILLLLALNLLPRVSDEPASGTRWLHACVAGLAGIGIGSLSYAVMTRNFDRISGYYLAEAKPAGGGGNVVNVILVDFRGFDTFGEIIVLGIAAVAIFALLDTALRGAAARRLAAMRHPEQARDSHPLLPVIATQILLPIAITVAIYMFLRGHNAPGGGFIAGLVIAIALIMQYIASGYAWAATRARVDAQAMIGGGVAIAGVTGIAALDFGSAVLNQRARPFVHTVDR